MNNTGYYEVKTNHAFGKELKAGVLAGNVQFNRLHWHEHLEILCCLHGSFQVRVDGVVYQMAAGDLITINGGASHEIFDGTADGLQIIFSADPSLLHKKKKEIYEFSTVGDFAMAAGDEEIAAARRSLGKMAWLLTPDVKELPKTEAELWELEEYEHFMVLQTEEEWDCFHMELYCVLMHLARHKKAAEVIKDHSAPGASFASCIRILHQEYDQTLNAEILAKRVGVSEPTVYRMFQKQLGISLNDYLNFIRVSAVCGYLENTNQSITEIASSCGFTSLSNFYRVFQLYKGQSPRDYRREKSGMHKVDKMMRQDIMRMNRFQGFWELPYEREELLIPRLNVRVCDEIPPV